MTGVHMRIRSRSVVARLAKKVFVGDLNELFCITCKHCPYFFSRLFKNVVLTVKMINRLPRTPRAKIILEDIFSGK